MSVGDCEQQRRCGDERSSHADSAARAVEHHDRDGYVGAGLRDQLLLCVCQELPLGLAAVLFIHSVVCVYCQC